MRNTSTLALASVLLSTIFAFTGSSVSAEASAKAQRELEIMTGILETTLGFVDETSSGRVLTSFGGQDVEGYLLPGQGVVFLVSVDNRLAWSGRLLEAAELAEGDYFVREGERGIREDRVEDLRAALLREQEETRKRVEEKQEKTQEARRLLIEAIAEYGDSFTTLKDTDHINLILRRSGLGGSALLVGSGSVVAGSTGSQTGSEVLSIRRSEIREYKAGSLSLDQLIARAQER